MSALTSHEIGMQQVFDQHVARVHTALTYATVSSMCDTRCTYSMNKGNIATASSLFLDLRPTTTPSIDLTLHVSAAEAAGHVPETENSGLYGYATTLENATESTSSYALGIPAHFSFMIILLVAIGASLLKNHLE